MFRFLGGLLKMIVKLLYWMLNKLERKAPVSKIDFVDLSIGKVYFRDLTKGAIQRCDIQATLYSSVMNDALWFNLLEHELVVLNRGELNLLGVKDGDKVRVKLKEILKRYGLIDEVEVNSETGITVDEQMFMDSQRDQYKEVVKGWGNKNGNNNHSK